MSKSLIRKNQLHPDIVDLVGQYGSGYFFSINSGENLASGIVTIVSQDFINNVRVTGNQTVSGVKNFISRPTVNGTGVILSGDSYFYDLTGFLIGLIQAANSGVASLNGSYGVLSLSGISGVQISNNGHPDLSLTIEYTSGNFTNVDFVPQSLDLPHKEGRLYYSSDTKTFNAQLDIPDVTLNIGQEEYIRIINKTSNSILNGTPIYISGAQGQRPQGWQALASNRYHIEHFIGLATHDILNNEEGLITTKGIVNGINTSTFSPGDSLYLGETGNIINTLPNSSNSSYIKIGYAITSQNNGKVLVDIDNNSRDGNVIIKNVTGNPYYFIKSDIGKMITFSGTASTYTGYLNSTGGFIPGDFISIMNIGTGTLRITGEPGIVIGSRDNARSLTTQYSVMEAIYRSQDFWLLYGDLQ